MLRRLAALLGGPLGQRPEETVVDPGQPVEEIDHDVAVTRAADGDLPLGTYAPEADGRPDPGEVVWAWVPYEDDPSQGKDRPVLVLREDGNGWLGLMLSSKDHDRDAADEARFGRHWMDVGSGGWDSMGRPSEVRLDRLIRLEPHGVRREGAALDRSIFDAVLAAAAPFLS